MEGLRGISALLVFFVHFWTLFGSRSLGTPLADVFLMLGTLGHSGVDVFFALSGFIIYGMLLTKEVRYFSFVRRRIVRLYPTFAVVFLVHLTLNLAMPGRSKIPAALGSAIPYLAANALMLAGILPVDRLITVAWSLSYEIAFYVTMPLLFRGLNMARWPSRVRIAAILMVCAGWLALSNAGWGSHTRMIMFGCGMILREVADTRVKWGTLGNCAAAAFFLGALTVAGLRRRDDVAESWPALMTSSTFALGLLFLATLALGYFALSDRGWLARWCSWDWIRWFGNISYSYYLIHGLILTALHHVAQMAHLPARLPMPLFLALCVFCYAITAVGGAALFLAVEKRFSFPAPRRKAAGHA